MRSGVFIPLIDLAFLSLGAVIAILSQAELVRSLPVDVTEIDPGIAALSRDDVTVITITPQDVLVNGQPVRLEAVGDAVDGGLALLRVDRRVPTEILVGVMAQLAAHDVEIRIEVEQRAP